MGTQLKGNRAMKKMKKYANGNMIDPNTPGVANSLRPKLRHGDVPEGEPSSQGRAAPDATKGPSPVLTPAMKRKRLEERLRREQMKRRAAPAPAPMAPSAPPAGVMAGMDKPPMPMAKKGGKVKKMMGGGGVSGLYGKGAMEKELEAKKMMGGGMKEGGKVRGAGMAKKGVRACKMR